MLLPYIDKMRESVDVFTHFSRNLFHFTSQVKCDSVRVRDAGPSFDVLTQLFEMVRNLEHFVLVFFLSLQEHFAELFQVALIYERMC